MIFVLNISLIFAFLLLVNAHIHPTEIMLLTNPQIPHFLCAGVKYSETSVVIPAGCIRLLDIPILRVQRRIEIPGGTAASVTRINSADLHPDFTVSDHLTSPFIGIVHYNGTEEFNQQFQPRNLTRIPDNQPTPILCKMTAWMRRNLTYDELVTETVQVLPPSRCINSNNPHVFCSIFPDNQREVCRFPYGTPLTCDNDTVAGILMNRYGCESNMMNIDGVNTWVPSLRFTSMSMFHGWQNNGSFLKASMAIVILGIFSAIGNFVM